MRFTQYIFAFLSSLFVSCASANQVMDAYLRTIENDPNALYAFFKEMPKGGELHYHLDGGVYAETMLDLAKQGKFCIVPQTFVIKPYQITCDGITPQTLMSNEDLYQQIVQAWSMRDFIPQQRSTHDHFHAVFAKINGIESHFRPAVLADVMTRAANQHELYMEIFLSADNLHSLSFAPLLTHARTLQDKWRILANNPDFQKNVQLTVDESKHILQEAKHILGCEHHPTVAVCQMNIKFQYFVLREHSNDEVFSQALTGFLAATRAQDVVGVNIVQVEDSQIALQHYHEHMQIFDFLHRKYPDVHIALHAGEMNPAAVPPEALRFHIKDAIDTGHAQRIGHGVSIAYEDNATQLLQQMQQTPIPVEINLTSNQMVLNIKGKDHPLHLYLSHHVPVVLSTDDEGILRTDLTRQYVEAVLHHHLTYTDIQHINRNALTHSFLPGKSLWQDSHSDTPVLQCQVLNSILCKQFIAHEPKAQLQWKLEMALRDFEHKWHPMRYPSSIQSQDNV